MSTATVNTMSIHAGRNPIKIMATSAFQPKPETSYGGNVWSILISIFLIVGGASGQFVLRGTDSSEALVVAGIAFLIWDIVSLFRKKSASEKAEETYNARLAKMHEAEEIVKSDLRALPNTVTVRVFRDKKLVVPGLVPRLNGRAMTWNENESAYVGTTNKVRNIVNFNCLDLTATFDLAPNSGDAVMELFCEQNEYGITLPYNLMAMPQMAS